MESILDLSLFCSSDFRLGVAQAIEAYQFEMEHFAGVTSFDDQPALLRHTLEAVDPKLNIWVELGVATGRSTRAIARTASELGLNPHLHGFDSFQGLPEDFIPGVDKGAFAMEPPNFEEPNITLHTGWFDETLPAFAATISGQIGFIHFDADLYSSTRTAFSALAPHIGAGTALLFDEYWNFAGCYEHEARAFQEFIESSGLDFRYIGYNRNYTQASVMLFDRD